MSERVGATGSLCRMSAASRLVVLWDLEAREKLGLVLSAVVRPRTGREARFSRRGRSRSRKVPPGDGPVASPLKDFANR